MALLKPFLMPFLDILLSENKMLTKHLTYSFFLRSTLRLLSWRHTCATKLLVSTANFRCCVLARSLSCSAARKGPLGMFTVLRIRTRNSQNNGVWLCLQAMQDRISYSIRTYCSCLQAFAVLER